MKGPALKLPRRRGDEDPSGALFFKCAAAFLGGDARRQHVVDEEHGPAPDRLRLPHGC